MTPIALMGSSQNDAHRVDGLIAVGSIVIAALNDIELLILTLAGHAIDQTVLA